MRFYYGNKSDFKGKDGAVKVNDKEMQHFIDEATKQCLYMMKYNTERNSTFCGSGDTMVFGFVFDEDGDGQYDEMNIYVCRDYEEALAFYNKDIGDFEKLDWSRDYEAEEREAELIEELEEIWRNRVPDYNPHREI